MRRAFRFAAPKRSGVADFGASWTPDDGDFSGLVAQYFYYHAGDADSYLGPFCCDSLALLLVFWLFLVWTCWFFEESKFGFEE